MNPLNRRECFTFLGGLLKTAGTVLLASCVPLARAAQGETSNPGEKGAEDLEQRADQVASGCSQPPPDGEHQAAFLNGGFRKGGFANGGFRKGGFANAGFRNGGFTNGGFRKGGFANGGWRN
jgi:hypothetical protein